MATQLTPAEQKFFETGELQPGMAPAPAPAPAEPQLNPLDLAGVGIGLNNAPAPAPAPAPSPAAPAPAPAIDPTIEILRRSLAEANQQVGQLQQQIALQQAAQLNTQAPAAAPAPDKATDPLGRMFHELETVNRTVHTLQEQLNNQNNQNQQFNTFQQFQSNVMQLRDQFATTTPDFKDAYAHLRDSRIADLRSYGMSQQQINEALFREEVVLSENAIRQGRNPAEVVYEMSKRHGYAPKIAAAPAQSPQSKLETIEHAQSAARNLPKIPQNEDLTAEGLKAASEQDLNRLVLDPKAWSKIVGGDQYPL